MTVLEETLAVHHRYWRTGESDTEEMVRAAERRLGCPLPPLLRAVYTQTSLRASQQLHLHQLSRTRVVQGHLLFGYEQQACWDYAIRLADFELDDPPVYCVIPEKNHYAPTDWDLASYLCRYWIINRPFEPPRADVGLDVHDLRDWRPPRLPGSETVLDEFLVKDCYVYFTDWGWLGARTNEDLRRFLQELDELDDADIYWSEEGAAAV